MPGSREVVSNENQRGFEIKTFGHHQIKFIYFVAINNDGSCPRLFGKCSGKRVCVPYSVWCDGQENCGEGDVSDEKSCNDVITEDWKYTCKWTAAFL